MEDPKQVIYVIKIKNQSFINYKQVIQIFFFIFYFLLIVLIVRMGEERFTLQMSWTHQEMPTKQNQIKFEAR